MKLAILGYGAEGKSIEKYFKTHPYENVPPDNIDIEIFDNFKDEDIDNLGLDDFDVIFRSPSVPPHYDFKQYESENKPDSPMGTEYLYLQDKPYWTSATKYFFQHCPCEIIAVSGTKGKGTTCSMITAILESINQQIYKDSSDRPNVYLVGNIGNPVLDVLDKIKSHDEVVFEMSSFQLWDLHESSYIGVLLRIEPDHLNIHRGFDDYLYAKSTIARYKKPTEHLVYFSNNPNTNSIAKKSAAIKHQYPITDDNTQLSTKGENRLIEALDSLQIPGAHNRENAEAALLAVAARYQHGDLDGLLCSELYPAIKSALANFSGLPHRCQFLRELKHVKYYDDNYSSALPAMDVALKAFEDYPTILIAGGYSKGTDQEIKERIFSAKNLHKAILIGSTAQILADGEDKAKYELANSLEDAVKKARAAAEAIATKDKPAVVLMSPGFASFDMFKNFTDRGEQFAKLVKGLK
ncbi:UDP-N-acetylmuramoyl-L-alanine--D-glutamate ligase [Candidatus Saccharibacteria bacterium]|nr:UDP-N-acetylmuramoyl-L-alanine--D-glutamate ligase [Candidatus Saccharibacteria bacterium]